MTGKESVGFSLSWTFVISLLVILTVYYWPYLIGQKSFYELDIGVLQQPRLHYIRDALDHGRFPLWNQYLLCGMPELSIRCSTPANPFELLLCFLPFNSAYAIVLILDQLVAGVGAGLLISAVGWGIMPAILAGASFGLSSFLFSLQPIRPMMTACAWCPLAAWAFLQMERASGIGQAGFCILASLAVFVMMTGGATDVVAPCLGLLVLWFLLDLRRTSDNHDARRRVFSLRILALLTGLLLSAPGLLPVLEWIAHSPRVPGLALPDVLRWSANWYDVIGLLLPQPLGDRSLITNPLAAVFSSPGEVHPYISSIFLGPVIFSLAIWGIADKTWSGRWLALSLGVVSGTFAMGEHISLIPYLVQIFNLSMIRFPIKCVFFLVVPLLLAAARGLYAACQHPSPRTIAATTALWAVIALLGAGLALPQTQHVAAVGFAQASGIRDLPLITEALLRVGQSAISMSLLGLLVCIIGAMVKNARIRSEFFALMCICTTTALLLWQAFTTLRHEAPPDFFNRPYLLSRQLSPLAASRGWKAPLRLVNLTVSVHAPLSVLQYGDPTVNFYQFARQLLIPLANVEARIAVLGGDAHGDIDTDVPERKELFRQAYACHLSGNDLPLAQYCQMTSSDAVTQYVRELSLDTLAPKLNPYLDDRFFEPVAENHLLNIRIYAVKNSLPRAYFAQQIKWGRPHDEVLEYVACPDVTGFDPHHLTILEHDKRGEHGPKLKGTEAQAATSTVDWLRNEPECIQLRVSTSTDNFLVLTDTFYPGWSAYVDNHRAKIFRANSLFRAVFVPSGQHIVEFKYWPLSFAYGLSLAGLGFVIIVGLLVTAGRSKKP